MSTTTYIGPYLVIPPTPQSLVSTARVCAKGCTAPVITPSAKFCGNCGGSVIEQQVTTQTFAPLSISKLADAWVDFMWRPEYGQNHSKGDVWLPNHIGHGITINRGAEDSFVPLVLATIEGAAMLQKASQYYHGFVQALKTDFGLQATWEVGVVVYSH